MYTGAGHTGILNLLIIPIRNPFFAKTTVIRTITSTHAHSKGDNREIREKLRKTEVGKEREQEHQDRNCKLCASKQEPLTSYKKEKLSASIMLDDKEKILRTSKQQAGEGMA